MDIVLGAIASSIYFARLVNQDMPLIYWVLLAGSVWLIYLTDHIFDSYSIKNENDSARRVFFKKYRKLIITLIALLFTSLLSLLIFIPLKLLLVGIPGTLLIGIYLFMNQLSIKRGKYYFPRELIIAVLYLYGVSAYPLLLAEGMPANLYFYLAAYLFLILGNVLIYTFFAADEDKAVGVQALGLIIAPSKIRTLNLILLIIAIAVFVLSFFLEINSTPHTIIGISMAAGLLCIQFFNEFFGEKGRYGTIADAVFILPFILLF